MKTSYSADDGRLGTVLVQQRPALTTFVVFLTNNISYVINLGIWAIYEKKGLRFLYAVNYTKTI